jgi:hypothetical protein
MKLFGSRGPMLDGYRKETGTHLIFMPLLQKGKGGIISTNCKDKMVHGSLTKSS